MEMRAEFLAREDRDRQRLELRRGLAVQGNFLSLTIVVACGGLLGQVMRD